MWKIFEKSIEKNFVQKTYFDNRKKYYEWIIFFRRKFKFSKNSNLDPETCCSFCVVSFNFFDKQLILVKIYCFKPLVSFFEFFLFTFIEFELRKNQLNQNHQNALVWRKCFCFGSFFFPLSDWKELFSFGGKIFSFRIQMWTEAWNSINIGVVAEFFACGGFTCCVRNMIFDLFWLGFEFKGGK